ncbi:MAG TPA: hypothetical protein VFE33_09055 [Thermoanaerobaculia bacterium]|nr:hypothetical protein [Thermoanaerobaculia bacterium]
MSLLLGRRQLFSLLFVVESFEPGPGFVGEAVLGGPPQLLVLQEREVRHGLGHVVRHLLLARGDRGQRVQKLRFQAPVGTLGPTLEMVVQRGRESKRYSMNGHGPSL